MPWAITDLLSEQQLAAVRLFFMAHPALGQCADAVCIALTGSYAFGLGGPGADVDVTVLCPDGLFADTRARLIADGRIGEGDEPGEDITGVVGDYVLQSVDAAWESVRDYRDLTQVFICAHLIPLSGRTDLAEQLIEHCRRLPTDVAERVSAGENAVLDQNVYAFLRSFQIGDSLGRLLARTNILRASMRLAFLAERQAPPYDKHLARLLPRLERGTDIVRFIGTAFTGEPRGGEDSVYAGVAAAPDWRQMYVAARETPVMQFVRGVRGLLAGGR